MNKELFLLPCPRKITCCQNRRVNVNWSQPVEPLVDTIKISEAEGYRLKIDENGPTIVAHDAAGAFYAKQTLRQIMQQFPNGEVPMLDIVDWPDFHHRGIMLDVSRDKIPTIATLLALIDLLASWKINQIQIYLEHTFAYRNHKTVWQNASPFTAEDIRHIDAYCRERFIELVPFQNSFGHMHRWLKHDQYRHFAEMPSGWPTAWSMSNDEPFSLCPTDPMTLRLLEELYDELLPNFSSKYFMVGCDETFDVGEGRSKEYCRRIGGKGQLYLEYINKIHRLVSARGKTMMYSGDIIIKYPELIHKLPPDAIIQHWGYGIEYPFMEESKKFCAAGVPFYLLCSNSTYNSLVGRVTRCMGNIRNAIFSGLKNGSQGIIITDWGDYGHWQPLCVSYPGYLYMAAMSWYAQGNDDIDIAGALDMFVFHDRAGVIGKLLIDLGNCYLKTMGEDHTSNLYMIFRRADRQRHEEPFCSLRVDLLQESIADIRAILERMKECEMAIPDAALVMEELRYGGELLIAGCEAAITLLMSQAKCFAELAPEIRQRLCLRLEPYWELHRKIWLARNREGGLEDSLWWNRRLMDQLRYGRTVVPLLENVGFLGLDIAMTANS